MTEIKYIEEISELFLKVRLYFNGTQEIFAGYFFDYADWARRCKENNTDGAEKPTVSLKEASKLVLQEIGAQRKQPGAIWFIFLLAYCPYMDNEFWQVRYEGVTDIEKTRVLICQDIQGQIEKLES